MKKYWELAELENEVFLSRPFWIFWVGHFEFFFASSQWKKQPVHMRYHLFLHYRWCLQNLGKEAVQTNMHTTVRSSTYQVCNRICHKFNLGLRVESRIRSLRKWPLPWPCCCWPPPTSGPTAPRPWPPPLHRGFKWIKPAKNKLTWCAFTNFFKIDFSRFAWFPFPVIACTAFQKLVKLLQA